MQNVKSRYFNIGELLHNDHVVMVAELLSQRRYVPNVKPKYFNISELLHNPLVAREA